MGRGVRRARSRRCTATCSGACLRPRSWSRGSSTSGGRDRAGRRRLLIAGGIGLLLLLLSYVPLLVHELQTNFSEVQAALGFLSGGGEPSSMSLPVVSWSSGCASLPGRSSGSSRRRPSRPSSRPPGVIAAVVWRSAAADDAGERRAARWFGLTLLWTTAALTVAASGLATVVPRLPNDHYHAFADPIVFVTVGLGLAALARLPRHARATRRPAGRCLGWEPSPPVRSSSGSSASTSSASRRLSRRTAAGRVATRPRSGSWMRSATKRSARTSSSTASPTSSQAMRSASRSSIVVHRCRSSTPCRPTTGCRTSSSATTCSGRRSALRVAAPPRTRGSRRTASG